MQPIATIKRTKEIQERYQIFTKKSYGQNFIIEPKIVEKIAMAAIEDPSELVFEIGPGIGALTQFLCQRADCVIALEIDERLPEILKKEIDGNLEIILQDVLSIDIDELIASKRKDHQKVVFASNLPYYITTPILFKLFEAKELIERITVMMQKEVGARFLAANCESEYNALSVITQYRCDVKKIMDVSRHVFWPKPNVDSMVVQFTFHHKYHVENEDFFFEMVKACFQQRRKTIYNNLGQWLKDKKKAEEVLSKASIPLNTRAQQLSLDDFILLYEVLA
ncbi:16S rRNA (adenine(1518)-N(6)/adenine(1519)-N(6))-dimethyltransferase RsmA [Faecalicoccus pleomorphus]|uniref:16S rRNA (adenine(1518)-N(6)/adenine(1519)-N(6))- dimethyltransferase RsmA n=1 Tax=Faecalicoccus pleomorphus TaxID=1323 RepID=UPI00243210B2|nr:16S rRNA (adenine(1518)-N(6)/adenine(1519)-N(6))-dimethyltransferase RsmA [Faecalicoccus pleomorphus]